MALLDSTLYSCDVMMPRDMWERSPAFTEAHILVADVQAQVDTESEHIAERLSRRTKNGRLQADEFFKGPHPPT
eukprot:gene2205-3103_t